MPNAKTAAEISQNPSRYLCALGYFNLASLIDIKLPSGTPYIHSAVQRRNFRNMERVDNWLDKFGMERHQIHCSGMQRGPDLFQIMKGIGPRMLFPIHTEQP